LDNEIKQSESGIPEQPDPNDFQERQTVLTGSAIHGIIRLDLPCEIIRVSKWKMKGRHDFVQ